MPPIRYMDFDLEIHTDGAGFRARVRSPGGDAETTFGPLFGEIELENYLLKLGQPRRSTRRIDSPAQAAAKALGKKLFAAVFANDVRACFRSSLESATQQDVGLRVRLHLKNVPALSNLPWEYLYDEALDRFLALSRHTPLVRYLPVPESIRPLKVSPPLNILVMISSPRDYQRLAVQREWASLTEALRPMSQKGLVTISLLETATTAALNTKLQQGEFHVFHFIGHGGFDSATQDGLLIFEDEQGLGRPTSGERLGVFLHDHRPMRLAVLNACEGARTSTTDPFSGVAQTLIQQRIPAVVGMQFEITDEAAITFAQRFYSSLAEALPVDAALGTARMAIYAENDGLEWGTPSLYMRSPDGHIFDMQTPGSGTRPFSSSVGATKTPEPEPVSPLETQPELAEANKHSASQLYSHQASGFALAGRFSRPVQESVVPRCYISLPALGGQVATKTEGFRMRETLSFVRAQANVAGVESEDVVFRTSVHVVVEGLNILSVLTADRIVARLAASQHAGTGELSVVSTGSYFENLRIAGIPLLVKLGEAPEPERDSRSGSTRGSSRKGESESRPNIGSLVKQIESDFPGLKAKGQAIQIADFGTVHFAELETLPAVRRLTMLRVELNASIAGSIVVASCECGGTPRALRLS